MTENRTSKLIDNAIMRSMNFIIKMNPNGGKLWKSGKESCLYAGEVIGCLASAYYADILETEEYLTANTMILKMIF